MPGLAPSRAGKGGGLSLGTRLTLALVGVSVFSLLAVGVLFYSFVGRYIVDQERDRLLTEVVNVSAEIEALAGQLPVLGDTPAGNRMLQMLLRLDVEGMPAGTGLAVYRGGTLIAGLGFPRSQAEGLPLYEEAARLARDGASARIVRLVGLETPLLIAAAPVTFADATSGIVVATLAANEAVASRRSVLGILLVSGGVAVALSLMVGLALGNWLIRPLRRLSRASHRMAAGSYDEPVTGDYPGEVNELAQGLETMRREVRHSEQSLRAFVASAAHELRTPLTSIAGFSQALLDGTASTPEMQNRSAAAIYRESTRLHRLVDTLLTLSRYDSREFQPALAWLDARQLVAEEIQALSEAGVAEAGRVTLTGPGEVWALTDALMLRQAVGNLLRNAVQYGGSDPVGVEVRAEAGRLHVTISNGGSPIPNEERSRLFDRFYRGRTSGRVEGFGLGLPLVHEICQLLGGEVLLLDGTDRTVFRIDIPLQAPGAAACPPVVGSTPAV